MVKLHSSFLVRCWDLGAGVRRVELEHIQSGEKALVASVAAAIDWIDHHSGSVSSTRSPVTDDGRATSERGAVGIRVPEEDAT